MSYIQHNPEVGDGKHAIPTPLELIGHFDQTYSKPCVPEVFNDFWHMRGRSGTQLKQREDSGLSGHPTHLLDCNDVELQVKAGAVGKQEMRAECQVELLVVKAQRWE